MVGWHHWPDGPEFEQALGVGVGKGSLVCWSPWVTKNWTWLSDWAELILFSAVAGKIYIPNNSVGGFPFLQKHVILKATNLGLNITSAKSVQFRRVWLFASPWNTHSMPGFPVYHQLLEFTQIYVHWVGNAIRPSHPMSSPSLPAFNLSQHQGLFKWVSSSQQVPKYWSFSFNISPFNEHPGLISFRMVWLDLLAVQGTLKSLLQHHSSKASILLCSAFFIVQLVLLKNHYYVFSE